MQTITIAPPKRSWFSLLSWAVVLAVLVVSWQGAEMAPLTLIKDGGNMATFAADFFPPDFSQWQDYLTEMAVTLQIAVWGTALAVVLSIRSLACWRYLFTPPACSPSCFPKR